MHFSETTIADQERSSPYFGKVSLIVNPFSELSGKILFDSRKFRVSCEIVKIPVVGPTVIKFFRRTYRIALGDLSGVLIFIVTCTNSGLSPFILKFVF